MSLPVEVVLRQRLMQSPGVASLVGDRIMPTGQAHDEGFTALPMVTYQRIRRRGYLGHDGAGDMRRIWIQFSCWARSWGQARTVADAVEDALDGWSDRGADPRVDLAAVENSMDVYEKDEKIHQVVLDVSVQFAKGS